MEKTMQLTVTQSSISDPDNPANDMHTATVHFLYDDDGVATREVELQGSSNVSPAEALEDMKNNAYTQITRMMELLEIKFGPASLDPTPGGV
jgi:hypothetical protein